MDVNAGLNYAVNDNSYAFAHSSEREYSSNNQGKRYAYGRFSTQYQGWPRCLLDFGIMYTYNQFKTELAVGDTRMQTHRYSAFGLATYNISDYWNMRAGLTVGGVHGIKGNDLYVQPMVNLSHASENGKVTFEFQYSIFPEYAKLYQLTEASYRLDEVVSNQGNPNLKPFSNVHQLNGMLTLWGWLTFKEELEYNARHVDDYYFKRGEGDFCQTYVGARYFKNASAVTGSFELSSAFSIESTIGFRYNRMHLAQSQNHKTDLLANVSVNYLNAKRALSISAEYSKNKESQCILQGFRQMGQDMCQITILKSWLAGGLRAQLSYMVPLHWGLSSLQKESVKTDFYSMSQNLNLRTYDNMLFLRLTYSLHKGKKNHRITDTGIYDDEAKPGRKLFGND